MRPAILYGAAAAIATTTGGALLGMALVAPTPFVGIIAGPMLLAAGILFAEAAHRHARAARARAEARRRARARRGYVHDR